MPTASGIVRGCGTRVKGGVYAESKLNPFGKVVECFLIDPPMPINMEAMGLSTVGVKLLERRCGSKLVYHVFDYVGESHYPNVADFIEEVRRFGASRRLPKNLEFGKLSSESRLILIHRKAIIEDPRNYYLRRMSKADDGGGMCPHMITEHRFAPNLGVVGEGTSPIRKTCAGLWWEDVVEGELRLPHGREIRRTMPAFTYDAWRKPDGETPEYITGAFMALPLTNLAVVRDPEGDTHRRVFDRAAQAGVATEIVDE